MSDNLCGPSNALKRLGEHADRDLSAHQDRLIAGGRPGFSSFRGSPRPGTATAAGDQAFANFEAGGPTLGAPGNGHLLANAGSGSFANVPAPAPFDPAAGWVAEYRPAPPGLATVPNMSSAAHLASAPTSARGAGFLSDDKGHPLHPGLATPPGQPGMRFAHQFPSFASAHGSAGPFYGLASHPSAAAPITAQSTQQQTSMVTDNGVISEDAMERAFRQFEDDLAFNTEMNDWMAAHGPTATEQAAAATDQVIEELAAGLERQAALVEALDVKRARENQGVQAQNQVDAKREETEQQRQKQDSMEHDELRLTAQEIVGSIGSVHKFQESNFLRLMRQITEGDVIVDKDRNDFVETKTMLPVSNAHRTDNEAESQANVSVGDAARSH